MPRNMINIIIIENNNGRLRLPEGVLTPSKLVAYSEKTVWLILYC